MSGCNCEGTAMQVNLRNFQAKFRQFIVGFRPIHFEVNNITQTIFASINSGFYFP